MANDLLPKRPEIESKQDTGIPYNAIRAAVLDTFRSFTFNGKPLGIQGSDISFPVPQAPSAVGSVSIGPVSTDSATPIPQPYSPAAYVAPQQQRTSPEDFRALLLAAGLEEVLVRRGEVEVGEGGVQEVKQVEVQEVRVPKAASPGAQHVVQSDQSKWHGQRAEGHHAEKGEPPLVEQGRVGEAPKQSVEVVQNRQKDRPSIDAHAPQYSPPAKDSVEPQVPYHQTHSHPKHSKRHEHKEEPKPPGPGHPPQTINHTGPQQVIGMVNGQLVYLLITCQLQGVP